MLPDYVFCISIPNKTINAVDTYLKEAYCQFGEVIKHYPTMAVNSKTNSLQKLHYNLESSTYFHCHTDKKQAEKYNLPINF